MTCLLSFSIFHSALVYHIVLFFFFNHPATTEIYTLSLHDALPISRPPAKAPPRPTAPTLVSTGRVARSTDRKSTRLNSSHTVISYAVFCLKKKKKRNTQPRSSTTDISHVRNISAFD